MNVSHAVLMTGSRTWDDPVAMREAFHKAWLSWGPARVTYPLLISGNARDGADAMAEQLWSAQGFPIERHPADWAGRGRRAGFDRNSAMVQRASQLRAWGVTVIVTPFLDFCQKPNCSQADQQQLFPHSPGHFSHGTVHCRAEALAAGLRVLDTFSERTLPF